MTYYCAECVVNWHPYQTDQGACPKCGSGTRRLHEPASDDADDLFAAIKARRDSEDKHVRFEAFYAERELRRAAEVPTVAVDSLEIAAGLDDAEPRQEAA